MHRVDDEKWGLIAGWVDANESPAQTVVRELAEEAGVVRTRRRAGRRVLPRKRMRANVRTAPSRSLYLCSIVGGELRPQLHEVSELAWRAIDDVAPEEWHMHHETLARDGA